MSEYNTNIWAAGSWASQVSGTWQGLHSTQWTRLNLGLSSIQYLDVLMSPKCIFLGNSHALADEGEGRFTSNIVSVLY